MFLFEQKLKKKLLFLNIRIVNYFDKIYGFLNKQNEVKKIMFINMI